MPSALPLLILAGAAAWALSSGGSKANPGGGGPVPSPGPSPKYDADLPQIIEATVDKELASETDPAALETFADALEAAGYPIAAAALRARAAQLEANPVTPPTPIQPMPPPPPAPPPAPPVVVPPSPSPSPAPSPPTPSGALVSPTGAGFGTDAETWDSSWAVPSIDGSDAASHFVGSAAAARAIQTALNEWAQQTEFPAAQLKTDGAYGPLTAAMAAGFQEWINVTDGYDYSGIGMTLDAPLAVDGIVGPATVAWLNPWSPSGPI